MQDSKVVEYQVGFQRLFNIFFIWYIMWPLKGSILMYFNALKFYNRNIPISWHCVLPSYFIRYLKPPLYSTYLNFNLIWRISSSSLFTSPLKVCIMLNRPSCTGIPSNVRVVSLYLFELQLIDWFTLSLQADIFKFGLFEKDKLKFVFLAWHDEKFFINSPSAYSLFCQYLFSRM